ncbi:glycosyltransferase family 9 protein [Aequorivita viscosa]|uniref:ADP-heptose:LPS heptosyltransferase n=1 Tax=Aequorivita viscosa TaxID=797419 RepID=A0A1M6MTC5_9FLAO|nr:glycosyltransferase family 9 protein [Aequorivita viscosa]SDX37710.1 ADP-heptose:LPS heptosyltransferase [Aequorivita viscosa]SHJ86731.1 ADP-heptose:LPS heptosyltransferase [Aequorivita viscosa]
MSKSTHILVIRLSAMGDVAMVVPILRILAQTYPEVKIAVLSRPFFKPLFTGIPNLEFLEADVYGKHKRLGLIKLAKEAKALGVDAVADLHNVIRSKIISEFLKLKGLKVASIDKGRAEKKALVTANGNSIAQLKTTHQRYADVFEKLGFPLDLSKYPTPPPLRLIPKLNALMGVEPKKLIGIAPFAAHDSKMYPLDLMKEVIANLDASEKYRIFLFGGGKKEIAQLKKLENPFSNVTTVAGKLTFEEELALISNLDLMLSMDSGNGHLAAIYGIPVITLWGVTHPFAGFTPFNQPESHQLVADRKKYPLIPTSIYGNKFPKGYDEAIKTISPEAVVLKIRAVLS